MDLLTFISTYWTILGGIVSFIFLIAYLQNTTSNMSKGIVDQKEEHDRQIAEIKTEHAKLTTRFDEHKDKITESMNFIQQDIREIMTILKTNK